MGLVGGVANASFIKKSLLFSIMSMFLLASFLALFLPEQHEGGMQQELDSLTEGYYDITGSNPVSEEIWGLSGIYTPYGRDAEGNVSDRWGSTADGWVYGARVYEYTPSQFIDNPIMEPEGYTVKYDEDKGLYYYTAAGANISDELEIQDLQAETPKLGTVYTHVAFDPAHRSDKFFTPGGRTATEDGFTYDFSGWRYSFSPLRDYKASNDLSVDRTTTSLSMVWYDYHGTEGVAGQLMLSGSDSGVSYITGKEIRERFDASSFAARFDMIFNGIDMHIYIRLDPYAFQVAGFTVEECYNNGYWSVMVTSPSITTDTSGFTLSAFSPDRVFDIVIGLLTFETSHFGLTGIAATLCSIFFTVSLYTSLLAIGVENLPVLILTGILAVIQSIGIIF